MLQQACNLDDGQAAAHPQQWRGLGRPIEGRRATHRRRRRWSLGRCPEGGPAAGRQQPRRGLCRRPTARPALAGCGTMTAAAREGGRRAVGAPGCPSPRPDLGRRAEGRRAAVRDGCGGPGFCQVASAVGARRTHDPAAVTALCRVRITCTVALMTL